jgi:hypothetical protein
MIDTVVEFCISKSQAAPLSLTAHERGEVVGDLLAEALYHCQSSWGEPEYAVAEVIAYLGESSKDLALAVGSRRHPDADIIVVDFISQLVSDRTLRKSYRFTKWMSKHGVPV